MLGIDYLISGSVVIFLLKLISSECVLVHLNTREDKFRLLVLMAKKLFSYVSNGCSPESPDSPMMWEVCLAGHVMLQALKDQVENFLIFVRNQLIHRSRNQDLFHLDHG